MPSGTSLFPIPSEQRACHPGRGLLDALQRVRRSSTTFSTCSNCCIRNAIETLTASIVWCTVWHDARERLRGMAIDTRTVVECGRDRTAVGHRSAPMHRFTTQGEEHG